MRNFLKTEHLKLLYHSWFESMVRYGIIHYGGTFATILKPIIMIQRFVIRTIHFVKKYDRVSYLFAENSYLTINQLYLLCSSMHMYNFINNYNLKIFRVNTRASQFITIEIPVFKKEYSRNQFCYSGNKIMN